MADLPVSLQSARMVMEMKSAPVNLFEDLLRIIAILEVKGIVNQEFLGERYYNGEIRSDLYNQLSLWKKSRKNRKVINFKKLQMAGEIFKELRKRVKQNTKQTAPPVRENGDEIHEDLLRAIITGFIDKVYIKFGKNYAKEDDERQADKRSVLLPDIPPMAVGEPFDLVINREDSLTGEVERIVIPLLTFSTELSFQMLDSLQPFSYRKSEEIIVDKNSLLVHRQIFLGNTLLHEEKTTPDFSNSIHKKKIVSAALSWYREKEMDLTLGDRLLDLRSSFKKIEEAPDTELKDFEYYCRKFISREINSKLNSDDLEMFFKLNPGFREPSIQDIIPPAVVSHLRKIKWPEELTICGEPREIKYKGTSPAIKLTFQEFGSLSRRSLMLPFGDYTGILMDRKFFSTWNEAVAYYNSWKRKEVFNRKWKGNPKDTSPEEIKDIPFPLEFEGGAGKENEKFFYYSVPTITKGKLVLIHFMDIETAEEWHKSSEKELELFMKKHNKAKIEDIFKNKGWTVR